MSSTSNDYGTAADDDYTELARLQQRTWSAAAPYLLAAMLAWACAGVAEYRLTDDLYTQADQRSVTHTVLTILTQSLLYAGLALFAVGLLVAALRQHERWRRDCGRWLGEPLDLDDDVSDGYDRPVE